MQKLVWQNANGDSIDLTSGNYGITQWEGFSNTSLNIQNQQVPFQDGAVFLDALLNQRELSVTLKMQDNGNLEERYRMRRELIHILTPKLGEGYLIYTNDFISKRIKCVAQVPLFPTHNSNDSGTPSASLAWTACEPYWEDMEETSVFIKSGAPTKVFNEGDVPVQMKLFFYTYNVENPAIIRIKGNKLIKYNGSLSKTLYVDTNYGNKKAYFERRGLKVAQFNGDISSVCFSKKMGIFVQIMDSYIKISYDGVNWENQVSLDYGILNDITYSEDLGLFVAVGNNGTILTSTNGINWIKQNIRDTVLSYIFYFEETHLFIICSYKTFFISTDGINWTEVSGSNNSAKSVSYSNDLNLYVGVGQYYNMISTDGINWSSYSFSSYLRSIIYSEKLHLFIAAGGKNNQSEIYTSSDGINWTEVTIDITFNCKYFYKVYYSSNEDKFVFIGEHGTILTSADLTTFTQQTSNTINNLYSIAFSKELNLYLVVGQNNTILTSNDVINWYLQQTVTSVNLRSIAYSEKLELYVAVGDNGYIFTSENLNLWIQQDRVNNTIMSVIFVSETNLFYAVGYGINDYTSSDGINWTAHNTGLDEIDYEIIYCKKLNIFVKVGNNHIRTSSDGYTWTDVFIQANTYFRSIVYSEELELFVAVGSNGIRYTSTDGINWTNRTSTVYYQLNKIIYVQQLHTFVIVGNNGTIFTSKDGINITQISYEGTINLNSVSYSVKENKFLIVGNQGNIISTYDFIYWDIISISSQSLINVINIKDNFIIVGAKSAIIHTEIVESENQIQNISSDSDISLNLLLGENRFRLSKDDGDFNVRIEYRQKYLGV